MDSSSRTVTPQPERPPGSGPRPEGPPLPPLPADTMIAPCPSPRIPVAVIARCVYRCAASPARRDRAGQAKASGARDAKGLQRKRDSQPIASISDHPPTLCGEVIGATSRPPRVGFLEPCHWPATGARDSWMGPKGNGTPGCRKNFGSPPPPLQKDTPTPMDIEIGGRGRPWPALLSWQGGVTTWPARIVPRFLTKTLGMSKPDAGIG